MVQNLAGRGLLSAINQRRRPWRRILPGEEVHPQLLRVQEDPGVGSHGRLGVSSQGCHLVTWLLENRSLSDLIPGRRKGRKGVNDWNESKVTTLEDAAAEFYQKGGTITVKDAN